jgi:hypothetical protein
MGGDQGNTTKSNKRKAVSLAGVTLESSSVFSPSAEGGEGFQSAGDGTTQQQATITKGQPPAKKTKKQQQ